MDKSYRKIIQLDKKFNQILDTYNNTCNNTYNNTCSNTIENAFKIKYHFGFEYDDGFIEYKRTLSSYVNKKEKLLRQIYWRISESVIHTNNKYPFCYYIIGLEDNGKTSNQSKLEFDLSLQIILDSIINTNIKNKYMYLFNELNKSYILVVKLWIEDNNFNFNYFE